MQHSALNKFLPQKSKGRYVFYGGGGGGGGGGSHFPEWINV